MIWSTRQKYENAQGSLSAYADHLPSGIVYGNYHLSWCGTDSIVLIPIPGTVPGSITYCMYPNILFISDTVTNIQVPAAELVAVTHPRPSQLQNRLDDMHHACQPLLSSR